MEQDNNNNAAFFRTVAGYHNKLIGEKDLLLADLQIMAQRNASTSEVIEGLNKLSDIEAHITCIRKHFGDASSNEKKSEQQPDKQS